MIKDTEDLKQFIKDVKDISFVPYFYAKKTERPDITDILVKEKLKNADNILGFQKHIVRGKERYRIGIKLSGRYTLVAVAEIQEQEKSLNIVTSWKTSRKWQKSIRK